MNIKPTRERVTFERVYRVRWTAGDADTPNRFEAAMRGRVLQRMGVDAEIVDFRRPKVKQVKP